MELLETALAAAQQLLLQHPDDPKMLARRGELYRQMKQYPQALADFNRAIELQPNYAWAIAHRGTVYRKLANYTAALADFNQAIALKPDYAWAIAYRGVINTILGRYEAAVAEFDRAIALEPTISGHWGNERGFPLSCLERYAEAIECYEQTLKHRADDPVALYCLAVNKARQQGLFAAISRISQARKILERLWNQDSQDRGLYSQDFAVYGLGGLAALEHRQTAALNYLYIAISLDKDANIEMVKHDPAWYCLQHHPIFQALAFKSLN